MVDIKPNSKQAIEALAKDVENLIAPLGYDLVDLEQGTAGGRKLVLYIDFLSNGRSTDALWLDENSGENPQSPSISLDDCVTVNQAVDELFETTPLLEGAYTLEVSSPGVERPLRKPRDYNRFTGRKIRLHTFRPLEKNEIENEIYWETHQKQKNFVGRLEGLNQAGSKVKVNIDGQDAAIPLELISKAHLAIDFAELDQKKNNRSKKGHEHI